MTTKDSEKDKMLAGRLYYAVKDKTLAEERNTARTLCDEYNATRGHETEKRTAILARALKRIDEAEPPFIEPPFTFDYGYNITLGRGFYANFGCCFLDSNTIEFGDNVLLGPNVHIYTPGHPLEPTRRDGLRGPEFAHPIKVGSDCWIGGGAIILGGATIGDGCTVGAGAVVTKDVPPWTVVAGNPARVVRHIRPGEVTSREVE